MFLLPMTGATPALRNAGGAFAGRGRGRTSNLLALAGMVANNAPTNAQLAEVAGWNGLIKATAVLCASSGQPRHSRPRSAAWRRWAKPR